MNNPNGLFSLFLKTIVLILGGVLLFGGCETPPALVPEVSCTSAGFQPVLIRFGGLTEILRDKETKKPTALRVFLELRDRFDSRLKVPFRVRFELYRYQVSGSNPKGAHLKSWPEQVLTEAGTNNLYWRDYLRAYEFLLDLEGAVAEEPLLLSATCRTAEGMSLETVYVLPTN
ncbi:MAG: hypothetical protein WHS88_05490 [Anaerohalosphaeraceae bacterium]